MAFVIARRATNVPADRPVVRLYWTGKDWVQDASAGLKFTTREEAFPTHEQLVKGQEWPAGGSPVVVER